MKNGWVWVFIPKNKKKWSPLVFYDLGGAKEFFGNQNFTDKCCTVSRCGSDASLVHMRGFDEDFHNTELVGTLVKEPIINRGEV